MMAFEAKTLKDAKTIFWNGPIGIFEIAAFAQGTKEIADTLAHLSATTIIGGGDSIAAIRSLHLEDKKWICPGLFYSDISIRHRPMITLKH